MFEKRVYSPEDRFLNGFSTVGIAAVAITALVEKSAETDISFLDPFKVIALTGAMYIGGKIILGEKVDRVEEKNNSLMSNYDDIVGNAWKLRAKGQHGDADALLDSNGIMPDGETDGK